MARKKTIKYKRTYYILGMLTVLLMLRCTEPFNLNSIAFENLLVIEAIITDEVKHHEINLSRTFSLEEFTPSPESGAKVSISDESQNTYEFEEAEGGKYRSIIAFGIIPGNNYTLSITTTNGKQYKSQPTQLPNMVPIRDVHASAEVDPDTGNSEMAIYVDGFDPSGNSKHYRYEYEETYEIIPPAWSYACSPAVIPTPAPEVCEESLEMSKCYNTVVSDSLILVNVGASSQSAQSLFKVRTISGDNAIIRSRYSILVKQYVQSIGAHTFYKVLNKFSSSDNIFSQNQPGFFSGNVYAVNNPNETVVGYFDISSVSSKRIFFNYSDFFPDENLPPYFTDCNSFVIDDINVFNEKIASGEVVPFGDPLPNEPQPVINTGCVDCRVYGTSTKPEFWID